MVNLALLLLLASAGEGFAFWPFCKSLCSAKFSCTSSQGTHELEKLFARLVKSDMSTAFLSGHCLCLQISPHELLAMEKTYCQDTGLSLVSWSLQVSLQIYFVLSVSNAAPPEVSPRPLPCSLVVLAVRKLSLMLRLFLISLSLFQLIELIVHPVLELSLCVLLPWSPQGSPFLH